MILKEMEILVALCPGRGMVSSEIGMVYITSLRKLLRETETCFGPSEIQESDRKLPLLLRLPSLTA